MAISVEPETQNTDASACQRWILRCSAPTDTVVCCRSDTVECHGKIEQYPVRDVKPVQLDCAVSDQGQ